MCLYLGLHSIRTGKRLKNDYPRSLTVFMIVKYLFGIKTRQKPILGARGYHFRGTLFDRKYNNTYDTSGTEASKRGGLMFSALDRLRIERSGFEP